MEKLYTTEEAAKYLSVRPNTIRAWLRDGILTGIKLGRAWRVREEDLNKFLSNKDTAAVSGN